MPRKPIPGHFAFCGRVVVTARGSPGGRAARTAGAPGGGAQRAARRPVTWAVSRGSAGRGPTACYMCHNGPRPSIQAWRPLPHGASLGCPEAPRAPLLGVWRGASPSSARWGVGDEPVRWALLASGSGLVVAAAGALAGPCGCCAVVAAPGSVTRGLLSVCGLRAVGGWEKGPSGLF